jgi:hypothetical protein
MGLITLMLIPFFVIVLGLSVRPLPLRVDASDSKERFGQHCRRVAFFLLVIPILVMSLIVVLVVHRFYGGPGLLAYRSYLSLGGWLWKFSSVAGILCGVGGCFDLKGRREGYQLIAAHVGLLFIAVVGPYLQYAGHPD